VRGIGVLTILAVILCAGIASAEERRAVELNTTLMESTFKLMGQGERGVALGTAFVLGRPYPNDATKARYVMVTAAHEFGRANPQSPVRRVVFVLFSREDYQAFEKAVERFD